MPLELSLPLSVQVELEEKERLDRFLEHKKDESEDFKVLVLKLVDNTGDIKEVSKITGVPQITIDQISRILRQLGIKLGKPYPQDYRRSEEAEQILENQLRLTFELLMREGIKPQEIAIGMLDESSPQTTANTVRSIKSIDRKVIWRV